MIDALVRTFGVPVILVGGVAALLTEPAKPLPTAASLPHPASKAALASFVLAPEEQFKPLPLPALAPVAAPVARLPAPAPAAAPVARSVAVAIPVALPRPVVRQEPRQARPDRRDRFANWCRSRGPRAWWRDKGRKTFCGTMAGR
jgi:hypothetical protein